MTNTAILAASGLLLFAYALDIVGRRFKLPSVVLLIATGLLVRHLTDAAGLHFNWVDPIVPVIGTLGLILIVLEGSLDLTVNRERSGLILTSAAAALLGFLASLWGFVLLFDLVLGFALSTAVLAAIPFAVISSAVAIPSAARAAGQAARVRRLRVVVVGHPGRARLLRVAAGRRLARRRSRSISSAAARSRWSPPSRRPLRCTT